MLEVSWKEFFAILICQQKANEAGRLFIFGCFMLNEAT